MASVPRRKLSADDSSASVGRPGSEASGSAAAESLVQLFSWKDKEGVSALKRTVDINKRVFKYFRFPSARVTW